MLSVLKNSLDIISDAALVHEVTAANRQKPMVGGIKAEKNLCASQSLPNVPQFSAGSISPVLIVETQ